MLVPTPEQLVKALQSLDAADTPDAVKPVLVQAITCLNSDVPSAYPDAKAVADALQDADWGGISIGVKLLAQAAVMLLDPEGHRIKGVLPSQNWQAEYMHKSTAGEFRN